VSRRNQSRRRRAYGRRQHEVRERRAGLEPLADWAHDDGRHEWLSSDGADESRGLDQTYPGYGR
jgi:hypothetical protein